MRNDSSGSRTVSAASLEKLAARSGIASEHVLLESNLPIDASERSQTIKQRFSLRNRILKIDTDFALFDDDFIGVRETRGAQIRSEHAVDLRYLDARPVVSRHIAKGMLRTAGALAVVALTAGLPAYLAILPGASISVSSVSGVAAIVAFWLFLVRSEERIAFRTRHGRVIVLGMLASFGCIRAARKHARKLTRLITEAQRRSQLDKQDSLRAEVREHYRLAETGRLSREARMAAIRRILARFD